MNDKRKQSLYFPEAMLKEIQEQAIRQDRSLSWTIQQAWKLSRKQLSSTRVFDEPPPQAAPLPVAQAPVGQAPKA